MRIPGTRTICVALSLATLTQIITACNGSGDGVDRIQPPTDTTSGQDEFAPRESSTAGVMLDTAIAGAQRMQSLAYIAEVKLTFGATAEVYSTTDRYRMQSRPPVLSSRR
jgi:hypothetical protein